LHTPLNAPRDIYDKLALFNLFSIIDLKDALKSILLTEKTQKVCSVITPFGVYSPQRSPFGV
jgi:Reverse transcriptase (RNA-dependent DNA polymerase)